MKTLPAIIIAVAALFVSSVPGGFIPSPRTEPATVADSEELVIRHADYPAGMYRLRLTKHSDGSVTLERMAGNVVDLDGRRITDADNGDDVPKPPDDEEDDATPEKPTPLQQVRANFADDEAFEAQRAALQMVLQFPSGLDLANANKFVQGQLALVFGDSADKWHPWLQYWITDGAVQATDVDEFKTWIDEAAKSLAK